MSTHKHFDLICVVVLLFTLLLTVLFIHGESFGLVPLVDEDAEGNSGHAWFTANDLNGDWNSTRAVRITLDGASARVSGGGAYVYNGDVIIAQGGRYAVSGTLDDGSIIVDADSSVKVWLLLDGADISCSDDACLRVDQADKVFLTLAEGSENSFTSGAEYSEDALADGTGGAVYAHDDLTINGPGSLTITAAYKHGIDANDDLVITGGSLQIGAPGDAIHTRDSLRLANASLRLDAGDEGIEVTAEDGSLYMESGSLEIDAVSDGVSAAGDVLLLGGTLRIQAGNDGIHSGGAMSVTGAEIDAVAAGDGLQAVGDLFLDACTLTVKAGDHGLQSDGALHVGDVSLKLEAEADGIHAAGNITLTGGDLTISAADDGIHSDGAVRITGGRILLESCYEGIEGLTIDVSGGDISVYPTDDGLNANGGTDYFGRPGMGGWTAESADAREESWIHISGGSITVVNGNARDADGLDSNGDILISGGTIRVSLNAEGSNNAIDYGSESGGVCEISGGNVIACGSYAMAEGFGTGSTQPSIMYNTSTVAQAGTKVSLEDAQGNVLLSYDAPCSFSSVSLSAPELKLGESYLVVIGEDAELVTLDEISASYGDAQSDGFFGNMNWGTMHRRDHFVSFDGGERPERPDASLMPPDGRGARSGMPDGEPPAGPPPEPPTGSPPEPSTFMVRIPSDAGSQPPEWNNENGAMPAPPERNAENAPEDAAQHGSAQGQSGTPTGSAQPGSVPAGSTQPGQAPAESTQTAESSASSESEESAAEAGLAEPSGPQPVSTGTWFLLAACALVLAAGILLAVKYQQ